MLHPKSHGRGYGAIQHGAGAPDRPEAGGTSRTANGTNGLGGWTRAPGRAGGAILYAVVARGKVVLSEYTSISGNFPTVTRVLLSKVAADTSERMSYIYDNFAFHYILEGGMAYVCLSHEFFNRKVAFAFLNDVKARFENMFEPQEVLAAGPFGMNSEFSRVLHKQMEFFTASSRGRSGRGAASSRLLALDQQEESVVENIEKLLQKGEKIELLVDTAPLHTQKKAASSRFTERIRNSLRWKNARVNALVLAFIVITALILVTSMCGGPGLPTC
ncbi:Vesicle-associated membrane protein 714 (AtVAMP714) [Durusdinium trenchii]|uniref:Vesicle-associated membrane protein 714 (AtVAMP714) n=1 Tax=Durusdinium trenchii TaxID=1381693 RepID=A0ABP0IR23_9DINO